MIIPGGGKLTFPTEVELTCPLGKYEICARLRPGMKVECPVGEIISNDLSGYPKVTTPTSIIELKYTIPPSDIDQKKTIDKPVIKDANELPIILNFCSLKDNYEQGPLQLELELTNISQYESCISSWFRSPNTNNAELCYEPLSKEGEILTCPASLFFSLMSRPLKIYIPPQGKLTFWISIVLDCPPGKNKIWARLFVYPNITTPVHSIEVEKGKVPLKILKGGGIIWKNDNSF